MLGYLHSIESFQLWTAPASAVWFSAGGLCAASIAITESWKLAAARLSTVPRYAMIRKNLKYMPETAVSPFRWGTHMQIDFLLETASRLQSLGLHTAVDNQVMSVSIMPR
jgi:hypothetical protein